MKNISKILILVYIVTNILLYTNCIMNKPQEDFVIKCKVISKGEQDKINHHKHYSTTDGISRRFIVYSKDYGYGELPVTVGTYITTEVNDTVTFNLNYRNINDYFNKNIKISLFYDWFFIFVFFTLLLASLILTLILTIE